MISFDFKEIIHIE